MIGPLRQRIELRRPANLRSVMDTERRRIGQELAHRHTEPGNLGLRVLRILDVVFVAQADPDVGKAAVTRGDVTQVRRRIAAVVFRFQRGARLRRIRPGDDHVGDQDRAQRRVRTARSTR